MKLAWYLALALTILVAKDASAEAVKKCRLRGNQVAAGGNNGNNQSRPRNDQVQQVNYGSSIVKPSADCVTAGTATSGAMKSANLSATAIAIGSDTIVSDSLATAATENSSTMTADASSTSATVTNSASTNNGSVQTARTNVTPVGTTTGTLISTNKLTSKTTEIAMSTSTTPLSKTTTMVSSSTTTRVTPTTTTKPVLATTSMIAPTPTSVFDETYFEEAQNTALAALTDASLKPGNPAFYVSTSMGLGSNAGTAAQSPSNDLQSVIKNAPAGSTVYLCQGDTFRGQFNVDSKSDITIAPYACNAANSKKAPVLTAAVTLSEGPKTVSTTQDGRPLWIYDLSKVLANEPAGSIVGGVWNTFSRYIPARFPNLVTPGEMRGVDRSEFIFFPSFNSTSLGMPSTMKNRNSTYWKNAIARVRLNNWSYTRYRVMDVDVANQRLIFGNGNMNIDTGNGNGFFLEHGLQELDAPGEFFFDPTTKLLHVIPYENNIDSPRGMVVAIRAEIPLWQDSPDTRNMNTVLTVNSSPRFRIYGVHFDHVFRAVSVVGSPDASLSYVSITNSLYTSVTWDSVGLKVRRSFFAHLDVRGIDSAASGGTGGLGATIADSTFKRVGLVAGYAFQPFGISGVARGFIANNTISECGYGAINPHGHTIVEDNRIFNVGQVLNDYGAIYSWSAAATNITIRRNLIIGATANLVSYAGKSSAAVGIYGDDCTNAWIIEDNIIDLRMSSPSPRSIAGYSVLLHNNPNSIVRRNDLKSSPMIVMHDTIALKAFGTLCEVANTTVTGNKYTFNEELDSAWNFLVAVSFGGDVKQPVAANVFASFEKNEFYRSATKTQALNWVRFSLYGWSSFVDVMVTAVSNIFVDTL
jgi:hypothetical protein